MKESLMIINDALKNLNKLAPDFNPMKGHAYFDAPDGSSRFRNIITHVGDVLEFVNGHENQKLALTPGKNGAVCITIWLSDIVGEHAVTKPIPEQTYMIKKNHGDLVAAGKAHVDMLLTYAVTFVLTPENIEGEKQLCLASVYPGTPDKEGFWEGIKEGDILTGKQLIDREITRVKDI